MTPITKILPRGRPLFSHLHLNFFTAADHRPSSGERDEQPPSRPKVTRREAKLGDTFFPFLWLLIIRHPKTFGKFDDDDAIKHYALLCELPFSLISFSKRFSRLGTGN
jgi:hypothetical protein